jgi:hypothetical protein
MLRGVVEFDAGGPGDFEATKVVERNALGPKTMGCAVRIGFLVLLEWLIGLMMWDEASRQLKWKRRINEHKTHSVPRVEPRARVGACNFSRAH